MKFSVLFSTSQGNCTYLESGETRLLIDAGHNYKQISLALEKIGVSCSQISAVLLTHEHTDHIASLAVFHKKHPETPIFASNGTYEAVVDHFEKNQKTLRDAPWVTFAPGDSFELGNFSIHPFAISHDAADPVAFVVEADGVRLGYAADLGCVSKTVEMRLGSCNALLLEFNHDKELLWSSETRPMSTKQRIWGRSGHLSNELAAELLEKVYCEHLHLVTPLHISTECNTYDLVHDTICRCWENVGCTCPPTYLPPQYPTRLVEVF